MTTEDRQALIDKELEEFMDYIAKRAASGSSSQLDRIEVSILQCFNVWRKNRVLEGATVCQS